MFSKALLTGVPQLAEPITMGSNMSYATGLSSVAVGSVAEPAFTEPVEPRRQHRFPGGNLAPRDPGRDQIRIRGVRLSEQAPVRLQRPLTGPERRVHQRERRIPHPVRAPLVPGEIRLHQVPGLEYRVRPPV